MWVHRLTDINPIKRTALCANCGRVKILKKLDGFKCGTATYEWDSRRKYGPYINTRPAECEVCGSSRRIVFDHSHKTSKFRGWLCNACNVALGLVEDNPEKLRLLADYLEKHELGV